MATTTNYGWGTPDDTDLVKDGALAIRDLGQDIDTTTKALNPETTTGDIAYRSATADTNTRLALGTAGQVLTVNSGATAPEWASPAGGGKVLQVVQATYSTTTTSTSTSYIDIGLSVSITPSAASSKILLFVAGPAYVERGSSGTGELAFQLLRGASVISTQSPAINAGAITSNASAINFHYLDSPATTSATTYKIQGKCNGSGNTAYYLYNNSMGTIIAMEIGAQLWH